MKITFIDKSGNAIESQDEFFVASDGRVVFMLSTTWGTVVADAPEVSYVIEDFNQE